VVNGVAPPPFAAIMHAVLGGGTPTQWSFNGLESAYILPDDIAGIQSLYGSGLGYVINQAGELNVYGKPATTG